MLTIKAMVKKDGLRADRTYNVKVCFTYKRKVKRLSTSLFVSANDLTKSLSFKDGTPIKRKIDKLVESYKDKCDKLQVDSNDYTLDEIVDLLQAEEERQKPVDFIQFCQCWIDTTPIKGKKNYQSALNSFIAYLGTEHLETSKLSANVLNGFMDYLKKKNDQKAESLTKVGKRVPSNRSVSLYLSSLRHLFNEAKKKYNDYDRNIIRITNSPFEYVAIPKQQATRKRAITAEQIKGIWQFPYERKQDGTLKQESITNLAKDCFILSFCLIGMNSADLFNCTEIANNTITYYRTKTTANFNRAINMGLKTIGTKLNLTDLEFYAARHSWATIALNKLSINKYIVHEALNHIDESMRVTDIYIQRDFVNENKANAKVVRYVFGK